MTWAESPPWLAEPVHCRYRPTVVRRVLAVVVAVAAMAGCGAGDDDPATTDTTTDGSPSPLTQLTVVLDRGDGSDPEEWTLTCEPAGGDHPDPEAACDTLADLDPKVFEPVPPDQACTMIFGGPQTATVTGRWNGNQVDAQFSRENGCEIDRWDAAVALLGDEGGVTAT